MSDDYRPRIMDTPDPNIKVAVSIPVYGDFHAQFGYSFAKMMLFTGSSLVADGIIDVQVNMVEGTYLDKARNQLAERALEVGATHILWLDVDMKFPQDALMRLLAHDKAIVGVNYPNRRFPIHHTAFKKVDLETGGEHTKLHTTIEDTGLEVADAVGFGFLLMKTSVFGKMKYPWFVVDQKLGEDVFFCVRAKKAGYKTFVDHDLSKQMVHYGPMGYTFLHAEEWMENEEKDKRAAEELSKPKIEVVK